MLAVVARRAVQARVSKFTCPRHDSLWVRCQLSSMSTAGRVVGFGKYKGWSFEETLETDPNFCAWVLRTSSNPESGAPLRDFGAYLQEHAPQLMSTGHGSTSAPASSTARQTPANSQETTSRWSNGHAATKPTSSKVASSEDVLSFGRYKGQSYQAALEQDPDWCAWVLRTSAQPDAHPGLMAFADFLRNNSSTTPSNGMRPGSGSGPAPSDGRPKAKGSFQGSDSGSFKAATTQQPMSSGDADNIVSFGRHRGKTFEAALAEDPDWCDWVVRTARGAPSDSAPGLLKLAAYLTNRS